MAEILFFWERGALLSGDNIPRGLLICVDHLCVTSQTLWSLPKTVQAHRSSDLRSPWSWQKWKKQNKTPCYLEPNRSTPMRHMICAIANSVDIIATGNVLKHTKATWGLKPVWKTRKKHLAVGKISIKGKKTELQWIKIWKKYGVWGKIIQLRVK